MISASGKKPASAGAKHNAATSKLSCRSSVVVIATATDCELQIQPEATLCQEISSPDGKTSSPALPSFAGAAGNTITKRNKSKSDPACRSQWQEDFTLQSSHGIIAIIAARLSIKYHPLPCFCTKTARFFSH